MSIKLVAACGARPLVYGRPIEEPLPPLMHIWRLSQWDTLYKLMYTFTESDWYSDEVSSLASEDQDLLVGVGSGMALSPRPDAWRNEYEPGYVYVYDEVRLQPHITKLTYLRHLNWFASQVATKGWSLAWVAGEVTGTPSQVCTLWRVQSLDRIEQTLQFMAYDKTVAARYAEMMATVRHVSRQYLYPESTEHIDNQVAAPQSVPLRLQRHVG